MIITKQKQIEFINDCSCNVDECELRNAILWYQDKPTASKKHIYMHGRYPAISIYDKKLHIHRLLMMYWNNTREIDQSLYVHHIDGNKLNAQKCNLMFMDKSEHESLHNKGRVISEKERIRLQSYNEARRGKPFPKETREKISIALRKRNARLKALKWEVCE